MTDRLKLDNGTLAVPSPGEAKVYASLSQLVYAERPLTDTLTSLVGLASEVLAETPDVSLTLLDGQRASTPASTGPLALQLDEQQYDLGTGPCLDAALFAETVELTMADADQPYPEFRQAAQREGVTHTLSVGLSTGDHALGALNIYNSTGRPFSGDSGRIAGTVATCVGIVLAHVDRYRRATTLVAQLEVALQSRATIDQAKGIVMARFGCSGEDAFKLLIRRSQQRNVKLSLIAQEIVNGASRG